MDSQQTTDLDDIVVRLPLPAARPVIAVGGELKNTMCVVEGDEARVTPVIDSLGDVADYRRFTDTLERLTRRFTGRPAIAGEPSLVVAHDLHPAYLSTVAAREVAARSASVSFEIVQHHYAHVASCMAEYGVLEPVIGIACDGTGYGTDGAIWGCEVLWATPTEFRRCASLQYFRLPGGDAAARQTWRPALALARQAFGGLLPAGVRAIFERVPGVEFEIVQSMLTSGFNCPETSSLGRLFDAVAFLTGVCDVNEHEGQAAIRLQEAAQEGFDDPYPFRLENDEGTARIATSGVIAGICRDVSDGMAPGRIAGRFHATVAALLSEAALHGARAHGVDVVVVSGGCFYNQILADRTEQLLREGGIRQVLRHQCVSPGDAGLSLGQAFVTVERIRDKN